GLTVGGAVRCWGVNGKGALGDGTLTSSSSPVSVVGLGATVTALALGDEHSCAITAGGAMNRWGYNWEGLLGDGTDTNRSTAVTATGLGSGVSLIAAGMSKTCAVAGGTLKCWSDNREG